MLQVVANIGGKDTEANFLQLVGELNLQEKMKADSVIRKFRITALNGKLYDKIIIILRLLNQLGLINGIPTVR